MGKLYQTQTHPLRPKSKEKTMQNPPIPRCPECEPVEPVTRRQFLKAAGTALMTASVAATASALPALDTPRVGTAEQLVKELYNTLTTEQKRQIVLPWESARRTMVAANWAIVEPTIGEVFTPDQQEIVRAIFKAVTNEEWYPKFLAQMKTDSGGFENYHVAIFGNPNTGKAEWVLTGRHTTMRAGGDPTENRAFGGPIFYGHAPKFNEDPKHTGNVFWYQAKRANELFQMLDGKQRAQALLPTAPQESAISFRKPGEELPGIPIRTLTRDQKAHVWKVMHDILAPYRKSDVETVMQNVQASGGLDAMHLVFYKQDDLGNDGIWDIWRLEGPAFVWHFRGAPHVHTWVNVGRKG
jgi:hypothetical protein